MKRRISLLLAIVFVLAAIAFVYCYAIRSNRTSEEITLHSGVKFGMTLQEVEELEKAAGNYSFQYKTPDNCYSSLKSVYASSYMPTCIKLSVYDSSLFGGISGGAGIAGARVGYCFDKNDTVNACIYYYLPFGNTTTPSKKEIVNAYIEKYGEPTVRNSYIDFPDGQAGDAYSYYRSFNSNYTNLTTSLYELSLVSLIEDGCYQWLIFQDDGSIVDIMLLEYEWNRSGYNSFLTISYSLRTPQEVDENWEKFQVQLQEKQQQKHDI